MNGKPDSSFMHPSMSPDASRLQSGTYLLRISNTDGRLIRQAKFIRDNGFPGYNSPCCKSRDFFTGMEMQCDFILYFMKYPCGFLFALIFIGCGQSDPAGKPLIIHAENVTLPSAVGKIRLPQGYTRVLYPPGTFAHWLRNLALKPDKTVYLYNGLKKKNQTAQYAVLDQPLPATDLQQCADVVMRLRAEYLFSQKQYTDIRFTDFEGGDYTWKNSNDRVAFERYLARVFGWCGSASLEKQLKPVQEFTSIEPGDVLIRGGFPGHALIVADIAMNKKGEKIFLLVQGYQPAQDMHVLVNPMKHEISPWFNIPLTDTIYTPEWVFTKTQLRRW